MEIVLIFAVIAAVATVIYFVTRSKHVAVAESPTGRDAIIATLVHETPAVPGHFPFVRSQVPLTEAVEQGIIEAFYERITAAQNKGWANGFDPAAYEILIFPSVRDHNLDGVYSPVFQVFIDPGDPYDNSIYDQVPNSPGGWIFAAEQVLTTGKVPKNVFIIAANDSREYTKRVVSYALDHLFAWYNDRELYMATVDHSQTGGHPLW